MTQFDKTAYWKKRIMEQIIRLYREILVGLPEIRDNMEYIGADPEELKQAIALIGEGFDALKGTVDHIKK